MNLRDVFVLERGMMTENGNVLGVYSNITLAREAALDNFTKRPRFGKEMDYYVFGEWERTDADPLCEVAYLLYPEGTDSPVGWPKAGDRTDVWYSITTWELVGGAW